MDQTSLDQIETVSRVAAPLNPLGLDQLELAIVILKL